MWALSTILTHFHNIISLDPHKVPYDISIIIPILQMGIQGSKSQWIIAQGGSVEYRAGFWKQAH